MPGPKPGRNITTPASAKGVLENAGQQTTIEPPASQLHVRVFAQPGFTSQSHLRSFASTAPPTGGPGPGVQPSWEPLTQCILLPVIGLQALLFHVQSGARCACHAP